MNNFDILKKRPSSGVPEEGRGSGQDSRAFNACSSFPVPVS